MSFPFAKPYIGDEEKTAILAVLNSGQLAHGASTEAFEEDFARFVGAQHAVAVTNCTVGMMLSLMAVGVGHLDHVLVPALTHVATAMAVESLGAIPVFADVNAETGCIDATSIRHLKSKPKAIMPVHFLGWPVDVQSVQQVFPNVPVVEDCALALGSIRDGIKTGTMGTAGSFSFYPSKHITTAEGGMVTTNNPDVAQKIRRFRSFGYDRNVHQRLRPGSYDVVSMGLNLRMSEIHAVIGRVQLQRVNGWAELRMRNARTLVAALADIPWVRTIPSKQQLEDQSVIFAPYCVNLVLKEGSPIERDPLVDSFTSAGIGVTQHYPRIVPNFSFFRKRYGFEGGEFHAAENLASRSVSLPVGPHITENNLAAIVDLLHKIDHAAPALASSLHST